MVGDLLVKSWNTLTSFRRHCRLLSTNSCILYGCVRPTSSQTELNIMSTNKTSWNIQLNGFKIPPGVDEQETLCSFGHLSFHLFGSIVSFFGPLQFNSTCMIAGYL